MGRPRKGFLFGSIRASKLGSVPIWSKPVGYDTVRKQVGGTWVARVGYA